MNTITYLGLDIAKLTLDLSPHPALPKRNYANDAAGLRSLMAALRRLSGPVQIICEATGGYEHRLLQTLHQAQVNVTLLNPRQVRDFARAQGLLAKTDRLDAAVLAAYGQMFRPAPTRPATPAQNRLAALVTRRQELLTLHTQEQHRAEHHHDPFVQRAARSLRRTLARHLAKLEGEIQALLHTQTSLRAQVERLTCIQGVGPRTAWQLLAALPELGTLARGQTAALAGLAPYNHDSGPQRGQRHIAHGRPLARTALYMAAVVAARYNPVLRPLYQRLRAAGKPAKVALVALMRKLAELANLLLKNPQLTISH
ncbi:MAG: IS110 family transposase [Methyloceanibacter sp.]